MYATFNKNSQASSVMTNKEHADHVAAKQNAKAESMGISARYVVKEATPTGTEVPRDSIPSVWL